MCEPDPKRVPALQLILKQLEDRGIPHFLFLNKIDDSRTRVREIIPVLQPASDKAAGAAADSDLGRTASPPVSSISPPSALSSTATHAPSEIVEMPAVTEEREKEARFHMLEQLADHDDELMEQLLSDMQPPRDKVFDDLTRRSCARVSSARCCSARRENDNGIFRLLKALRHEAPIVEATAKRLKLENAKSAAYVIKTAAHRARRQASLGARADRRVRRRHRGNGADRPEERVAGVFAHARRGAGEARHRARPATRSPWAGSKVSDGRDHDVPRKAASCR